MHLCGQLTRPIFRWKRLHVQLFLPFCTLHYRKQLGFSPLVVAEKQIKEAFKYLESICQIIHNMMTNLVDLDFCTSDVANRFQLYRRIRKLLSTHLDKQFATGGILQQWEAIASTLMVKLVGEMKVLSVGRARDVSHKMSIMPCNCKVALPLK